MVRRFVFEVFFERFAYSDSYRGACYYDTENNNCPTGDMLDTATRNANIQNWASQITGAGVPWLYWQVLPNADPHVCLSQRVAVTHLKLMLPTVRIRL